MRIKNTFIFFGTFQKVLAIDGRSKVELRNYRFHAEHDWETLDVTQFDVGQLVTNRENNKDIFRYNCELIVINFALKKSRHQIQ